MGRMTGLSAILLGAALWAGSAAAQDVERGARLFKVMCGTCHVADQPRNLAGPHLVGIVGRHVAGAEGFKYSPAMNAADFAWTIEKLDAYLTNPRAVVPGTMMVLAVAKPEDRAAILGYLQSLSARTGE